jgi:hypothetical protein
MSAEASRVISRSYNTLQPEKPKRYAGLKSMLACASASYHPRATIFPFVAARTTCNTGLSQVFCDNCPHQVIHT